MFFDYKKRRAEIWIQHKEDAMLMRKEGVSEKDIEGLLALDNHELYSDTNFYASLDRYIDSQHYPIIPGGELPDSGLDFMDRIQNEDLYRAMMSLKPEDWEIVVLHVVDGMTLRQIADWRGKKYSSVQRTYHRAFERLKKYFL